MFGRQTKNHVSVRSFEMPSRRLPLRADFPSIFSLEKKNGKIRKNSLGMKLLTREIEKELKQTGKQLEEKPRITIAYPHKRPSFFRGTPHRLVEQVYALRDSLMEVLPQIKWIIADGLCETKKLKRKLSKNQNIEKTLKKRHEFKYFPDLQKEPLLFADPENKEQELFVLFDDIYCQGTTAANMINFIEHNGGRVLGAIAGNQPLHFPRSLRQENNSLMKTYFVNDAYNKGRIPELANLFLISAASSKRASGFSAEQCLDDVESILQKWGYSLTTLTDGECQHIKPYIEGYSRMFGGSVRGHGYDGFIKAFANGP